MVPSSKPCRTLVTVTHGCDHRLMSEETGLDSWFLHEKLVLSLLSERDATKLTRRIPGPERIGSVG